MMATFYLLAPDEGTHACLSHTVCAQQTRSGPVGMLAQVMWVYVLAECGRCANDVWYDGIRG
jgi:hypothetical protein